MPPVFSADARHRMAEHLLQFLDQADVSPCSPFIGRARSAHSRQLSWGWTRFIANRMSRAVPLSVMRSASVASQLFHCASSALKRAGRTPSGLRVALGIQDLRMKNGINLGENQGAQ